MTSHDWDLVRSPKNKLRVSPLWIFLILSFHISAFGNSAIGRTGSYFIAETRWGYFVCGHRVPCHRLTGTFVACNSRHLKSWVGNSSEGPFWMKWGQTKYCRDFSHFGPIAVPHVSISPLCAQPVGPACQESPLCCLVSWQYVNSTCNSQYKQIPFLVLPTLDPP
jgi:hypothetical protein